MFLNKVIMTGIVHNQPELRHTKSSIAVTNFIIKTGEILHKIVCWSIIAEKAVETLRKGNLIYLEGEIGYQKKNEVISMEIKASDIMVIASTLDESTEITVP